MVAHERPVGAEDGRRDVNVAILGAGRMGGGLARLLAGSHDVRIGSREPERGAALAEELGAGSGGSYADAASGAEVVFLTVPWRSVPETLAAAGDLTGRVLVDVTNPYVDGRLQVHEDTSDAEEIQKLAPGARVVKGWNLVFSEVAGTGPDFGGEAASVLLAGDDEAAKDQVAALARDMGYDPVDCGPLANARDLERMLTTFGTLGATLPRGTWAIRILRRP
jgi:predicted dinucleotide-binding enzyme